MCKLQGSRQSKGGLGRRICRQLHWRFGLQDLWKRQHVFELWCKASWLKGSVRDPGQRKIFKMPHPLWDYNSFQDHLLRWMDRKIGCGFSSHCSLLLEYLKCEEPVACWKCRAWCGERDGRYLHSVPPPGWATL